MSPVTTLQHGRGKPLPLFIIMQKLGQHFLKSDSALRNIIESGQITPIDFILEIGPGKGVLTEELLLSGAKVLGIEKDSNLIPILEEKFDKYIKSGKLTLENSDVLKLDTSKLPKNYKLIANIPYYITGEILRKFIGGKDKPSLAVLLVQKEVADRIVAKDSKESLLSISIKAFGEPKIIKKVPKGAFNPPPKVDSAILLIEKIGREKLKGIPEEVFFKILHTGFAHKRKKLSSNLKNGVGATVDDLFEKLNLDKNVRAEDLKLETWIGITKNI